MCLTKQRFFIRSEEEQAAGRIYVALNPTA